MAKEDFAELLEKIGTEASPPSNPEPFGRSRFHHLLDSLDDESETSPVDSTQWAILPNSTFKACGATTLTVPSGVYIANQDNYGAILINLTKLNTDSLVRLPDSSSDEVLTGIAKFWDSKPAFEEMGHLFKRGVLLYGPAGSGKTVTIQLLIKDLIDRNGIVMLCMDPNITSRALTEIRRIEPERPIICVMEDLDELVERFGEHQILSILDGENQVNNIIHIASTNYPEKLDKRLINRPSRFDEVIKIDMPTSEARKVYLKSKVGNKLTEKELDKWVKDTKNLSIAHLRELTVAIFCLGRAYGDTLERLKLMERTPKSTDSGRKPGFTED